MRVSTPTVSLPWKLGLDGGDGRGARVLGEEYGPEDGATRRAGDLHRTKMGNLPVLVVPVERLQVQLHGIVTKPVLRSQRERREFLRSRVVLADRRVEDARLESGCDGFIEERARTGGTKPTNGRVCASVSWVLLSRVYRRPPVTRQRSVNVSVASPNMARLSVSSRESISVPLLAWSNFWSATTFSSNRTPRPLAWPWRGVVEVKVARATRSVPAARPTTRSRPGAS